MLVKIGILIYGYFAGALIQAGYWMGKVNKIDIRDYGSGNAGTTNVMRTLGKKAGIATYLLDAFKAVIADILIHFLIVPHTAIPEMLLFLYCGLGIVLGHNFPFYLNFKGGKGIAASSGVVISLMLFPKYCFMFTVFGILTFALAAKISRYVSLASLIGMAMFFVEFLIWGFLGWLPLTGTSLVEGTVIVFALAALAFIRHRSNIVRLVHGTERKIGQKKKLNLNTHFCVDWSIIMANISVLGAGSWGLGLALLLNNNGHNVTVWSVLNDEVVMLQTEREHKRCLPGVRIPDSITISGDTANVINNADVLVLAVASPYTRSTAKLIAPFVKEGQIIVNVAKGVEEHTLLTLCQIVEEEIPQAKVAVLSGPSHAEEVSRGIPTTCVIGAHEKNTAEYLQNIFMSDVFRVYTSPDMLGICIGGALKNVIALAAGIADGLGYGDNTKAALITRGNAEITRLGVAMGANPHTFSGLSGIGDLIVTCASMHSRNRRAGILIGKGYTKDQAMEEVQMVVEGVFSAKAALELSKKYNIEMPIVEQVNKVLFEDKPAAEAVKELMLRDKKIEIDNSEWK